MENLKNTIISVIKHRINDIMVSSISTNTICYINARTLLCVSLQVDDNVWEPLYMRIRR